MTDISRMFYRGMVFQMFCFSIKGSLMHREDGGQWGRGLRSCQVTGVFFLFYDGGD